MKYTWLKKANPDTIIKNQEIVTSIVPLTFTYKIVCTELTTHNKPPDWWQKCQTLHPIITLKSHKKLDPQALSLNRCFYQNNLSISYIHVPVIYQTTNIVTFLFSTLHGRNMVITIKSSILHSEYNPFII